MKNTFFKKLNRGCILLATLIIGAVVYIITFNAMQHQTQRELIEFYEQYLEAEKPFILLDETDDVVWEKKCTNTLAPFLSQSTEAAKNVHKQLLENRKYLKKAETVAFTSFEKEISSRPPTVTVEGDYARLAIAIEINYVQNGYTSKEVTTKHVLFCKENGAWRITVPDGTLPNTLFSYVGYYNDYYFDSAYAPDTLVKEVGFDA